MFKKLNYNSEEIIIRNKLSVIVYLGIRIIIVFIGPPSVTSSSIFSFISIPSSSIISIMPSSSFSLVLLIPSFLLSTHNDFIRVIQVVISPHLLKVLLIELILQNSIVFIKDVLMYKLRTFEHLRTQIAFIFIIYFNF